MVRNADCFIEDCKITSHLEGGILVHINEEDPNITARSGKDKSKLKVPTVDDISMVRITKCQFFENKRFAIQVTGIKNMTVIEDNLIKGTKSEFELESCGIHIGVGSSPKLFNNIVKNYTMGIRLISCDGLVFKNSISECQTGIKSVTYRGLLAESKIKLNDIRENLGCGIVISGERNHSTVAQNFYIYSNKEAGIRVQKGAHPSIRFNRISNNYHQGILIVEHSSAFVEGNAIYQNIKANIAFGGDLAQNTSIVNNKIFNGGSEGIFVMLSGSCSIFRNSIYGNYDGVVVMEAVPDISFNKIYSNRNNGVQLLRGSMPTMRMNTIFKNEGVGMVFRDFSFGNIQNNIIRDNEMNAVVEFRNKDVELLEEKNDIHGFLDIPAKKNCELI